MIAPDLVCGINLSAGEFGILTGSFFMIFALLVFFGFYNPVVMSHGVSIFPDQQAGCGATTLNMSLMGGAALMQWTSGFVLLYRGVGYRRMLVEKKSEWEK